MSKKVQKTKKRYKSIKICSKIPEDGPQIPARQTDALGRLHRTPEEARGFGTVRQQPQAESMQSSRERSEQDAQRVRLVEKVEQRNLPGGQIEWGQLGPPQEQWFPR